MTLKNIFGFKRALSALRNGSAAQRTNRSAPAFIASLLLILIVTEPSAQLSSSLLGQTTKVPPVEEAIRAEISRVENGVITLDVLPIPSVYLYRDKLRITASPGSALKLGAPRLPVSALIDDEFFGKTHVFRGPQQIQVPFTGRGKSSIDVTLVGCHAEAKICYPPSKITLAVSTTNATSLPKNTTTSSNSGQKQPTSFDGMVRTNRELNHAIAQAQGKFVIVDFWATWCAPCKHMEKTTFADADVKATMAKDFVLVKVDVSKTNPETQALLKRFSFVGPPGFAFFNRNGKEVQGGRMLGYIAPERFLAQLNLVSS